VQCSVYYRNKNYDIFLYNILWKQNELAFLVELEIIHIYAYILCNISFIIIIAYLFILHTQTREKKKNTHTHSINE
jgi:hypothetical protein